MSLKSTIVFQKPNTLSLKRGFLFKRPRKSQKILGCKANVGKKGKKTCAAKAKSSLKAKKPPLRKNHREKSKKIVGYCSKIRKRRLQKWISKLKSKIQG
jgi:hypothetical protein